MFICCGYNTFYFCDLCKNVCYHYTRSELLRARFYTLMHCHLIFLKILQQFTLWPAAYKNRGFHSPHIVAGAYYLRFTSVLVREKWHPIIVLIFTQLTDNDIDYFFLGLTKSFIFSGDISLHTLEPFENVLNFY